MNVEWLRRVLMLISYPPQQQTWIDCFGMCSSPRLFVHQFLPHVDAVIYSDVDALFLDAPSSNMSIQ